MVLSGDLYQTLITSERLTLRAFTAVDAAETFAEANARIATYMSWNPPASEKEFKAIWQGHLANMKAGRELHLVIRHTITNEFIGRTGLNPADAALLETGVWIKESAQGRGYGREAGDLPRRSGAKSLGRDKGIRQETRTGHCCCTGYLRRSRWSKI
jgi:RimJ/RimL family protein N-acetyltransferase